MRKQDFMKPLSLSVLMALNTAAYAQADLGSGIQIGSDGRVSVSSATFSGGVSVNGATAIDSATFEQSDAVSISASITVDSAHVGQSASIILVFGITSNTLAPFFGTQSEFFLALGADGFVDPRTAAIPALETVTLGATQNVEIFDNVSFETLPGHFNTYVGYQLSDNTLVYNSNTLDFYVSGRAGTTDPLSSMVAVRLTDTGSSSIPAYVKSLVEMEAAGTDVAGFPLENLSDDTVRSIPGTASNVVVKWLDPLTEDSSAGAPRYGSNNDYIAYFGEGWNSDWSGDVLGSAPQFNGSATEGWVWSNHEYISNGRPTTSSAPSGQQSTFANYLYEGLVLNNDVTSDIWSIEDVDKYLRWYKTQLGGSWFKVVQNASTGEWEVDRTAANKRFDSTTNTLLKVTGFTLSGLDRDDFASSPFKFLPQGVVGGITGDCSGGQSPWGTVFTAEENVQFYYGDLESSWTSRQQFIEGAGFDPGANISPTYTASSSSEWGSISTLQGRHNRDNYGFLSEIDVYGNAGTHPITGVVDVMANYYTSVADGGDGSGHMKMGSFGRARWENVTFYIDSNWQLVDGQPIVMYAGNDRRSGRIYKWYSNSNYTSGMTKGQVRALLEDGKLYVAHLADLDNSGTGLDLAGGVAPTEDAPGNGQWIELSVNSTDIAPNAPTLGAGTTVGAALQDVNWNDIGGFPDDNAVLTALFTAATKVGVMELNRPEDLEWNPNDLSGTPRLYVAFTNNGRQTALDDNGVRFPTETQPDLAPTREDSVGAVFVIQEAEPSNPAASDTFTFWQAWRGSRKDTDVAEILDIENPDNLMIDQQGGVWFGTDGNFSGNDTADGLYYLDLDPAHKTTTIPTYGIPFRVIAGPSDSEATGPAFNSDMTTIFFNVQHPGESSSNVSTWPQPR